MSQQTTLDRRRFSLQPLFAALTRRPRRAFTVPIAAAIIGLVAAGFAIFRHAPAKVTVVPPGYVAVVNQKGILMTDFITQAANETGKEFAQTTSEERSKVLREMIDEELLVQRGLMLDLPETTTEVRGVLADGVNTQVAEPLLAQSPSDDELKAFYDRHRANYATVGSMTVHDLVLHIGGYQNADQSTAQAQTDAAEAVYQLRAGASIAYMMEHFGFVDSGRVDNGEQLDFAARIHLGDKLYSVAATLGDGEISDPVAEPDGVHVLIMDRRMPPRVADFGSVRERVYKDFRNAQRRRVDAENLQFLRRNAQILLAPGQSQ